MTYRILSRQAKSVLESYNNKTSWCCFGLRDSDKTHFLLGLMTAIESDETSDVDHIHETILLVGLTAFKNYLQEKKNTELSAKIETLIHQHASVALTDEMQPFVTKAKTCIDTYGSVVLEEENFWPQKVAELVKQRSTVPTFRN